jgi:hypothetical protein
MLYEQPVMSVFTKKKKKTRKERNKYLHSWAMTAKNLLR